MISHSSPTVDGSTPAVEVGLARCLAATAWPAVATLTTEYVLIAAESIDRVAAAFGGAVLILLVDGTDAMQTVFSEASGINRNFIFLLLGIMLIVAVLQPRSRASPIGASRAARAST